MVSLGENIKYFVNWANVLEAIFAAWLVQSWVSIGNWQLYVFHYILNRWNLALVLESQSAETVFIL
jgi:hypothetical protein